MAQHSHSVYGNMNYHFHYHKNRASAHNLSRYSDKTPSHLHPHQIGLSDIPPPPKQHNNNELIRSKKSLFQSTEALCRSKSGKFSFPQNQQNQRNVKLHRSNPHLHFGDLEIFMPSGSNLNVAPPPPPPPHRPVATNSNVHHGNNNFSKSSPLNCSSGLSKATSKWRNEISNAANLLPRKWCDFVFRRNVDNKLYRSESFRFIQKTNSLQLLPHMSAGLNKYRNKKLQIPVSDDYVDPIDHVAPAVPPPPPSWNNDNTNSSSRSSKAQVPSSSGNSQSGRSNEDRVGSPNGDEGDEAVANYNAPYYYSDTIKDPTYCSPCTSWRRSCGDIVTLSQSGRASSPHQNQHPSAGTVTTQDAVPRQICKEVAEVSNNNTSSPPAGGHHHQCHNQESGQNRDRMMARKRYETAFLPTGSNNSTSQSTSPDVDCLLLAIESSCSLVKPTSSHPNIDDEKKTATTHQNPSQAEREEEKNSRAEDDVGVMMDNDYFSSDSRSSSSCRLKHYPSISYCQSVVSHGGGATTTTNSSPLLSEKKTKPTIVMPLSEPLPQKKMYCALSINNVKTSNASSCSSSSGPSSAATSCSFRPSFGGGGDKRILLMKDTSVSSLESIDSTRSEDLHLHPFSSRHSSSSGKGSSSGGSGGSTGFGFGGRGGCKLLSPISDKSPLEPMSMLQSQPQSSSAGRDEGHSHNQTGHYYHHHAHFNAWPSSGSRNPINTAELINVPWDMPKIKRRLALLADSGISLDCTGNAQGDNPQLSFPSNNARLQSFVDDSNRQYATCTTSSSQHVQGYTDPRGTRGDTGTSNNATTSGSSSGGGYGRSGGRPAVPNLHLNLDNGLVRDEYYEDPRLNQRQRNPTTACTTSHAQVEVQVHVAGDGNPPPPKPDRCRMKLDFGALGHIPSNRYEIDPNIELEAQEWFHGAITRSEAEAILRATKEGSFLVRNCESFSFNRYSLSLKSARGFIHVRIEPNSLGSFSLGESEFPSVPHLVLHFMYHRLPIKGAEHVKLLYPVITQLL